MFFSCDQFRETAKHKNESTEYVLPCSVGLPEEFSENVERKFFHFLI